MQQVTITQDMVVKLMLEVVKLMLEFDANKKELLENPNDVDGYIMNSEIIGYINGMQFVLNTLGVYIDGINWDGGQTNVENNEASGSN